MNTINITITLTQSNSLFSDYWENIQYYFSTAILPILLILSIVTSLIEIRLFLLNRMRLIIAHTSLLYYIIIAVTVIGSIILNQIPNLYICENLGHFFPAIDALLPKITILCDALRITSVLFPHCIGWFYLFLEISSGFKILSEENHSNFQMQVININICLISLVVLSGLLISALFVIDHHILHYSADCMMNLDDFMKKAFYRYLIAADISIGPYFLTLAVSFSLLIVINQHVRKNARALKFCKHGGRISPNGVSTATLANGVVAVILSFAHVATHFPVGICYSLQAYFIAETESLSQKLAELLGALYVVFSALENFDSLLDFIIYNYRIPVFRNSLFGKRR